LIAIGNMTWMAGSSHMTNQDATPRDWTALGKSTSPVWSLSIDLNQSNTLVDAYGADIDSAGRLTVTTTTALAAMTSGQLVPVSNRRQAML
jgi:hypothetical protein